MYDLGRSIGMMSGVLVGIVIAVIFVIVLNKNHKLKSDYDERQEQIHGKGYKYGFYTVVIYEALMMCLSVGGFPAIPIEQSVFHAFSIFLGVTVYCAYSIWKGAYWARNSNIKGYSILLIVLFALNIFPVIGTLVSGVQMVDGYMDFPFVNLFCALMVAVLALVWGIRSVLDSKAERED